MAIKQIEEIPQTLSEKRESYRAMIRADIQSAIDAGISRFEFDGDYNWKYLANYAREEADRITLTILKPLLIAAKNEHGLEPLPSVWRYVRDCGYIEIHAHKGADRIHVYGEINPDAIPQCIERAVQDEIEIEKRIAAQRGRKRGDAE